MQNGEPIMLSSKPYQPHTQSGRGATIADRSFLDFSVEELRSLIDTYQWLVFKHHSLSGSDVAGHLGKFGCLVQNDRRQNGILKLDGSKKEEVLLGEGFMPLHRDGAFMGNDIAFVGICCVEYQNVTGGGRTFISDIASAVKEVPGAMLDVIREKGIEGKPVDNYYTKSSDAWLPIPGFIDVGGVSYLNVIFPYGPGEKPSWLIRIPGVEEELFQTIIETLSAALISEKYCYYHQWSEGELLLLDNRRTLHGREAFQGQRSLVNIQVNADA
jgi:alpha-ketoglutarate-dependent taurine dioxygenase